MKVIHVIFALITGLSFGCDNKPVESLSPKSIAGSYVGKYENGSKESFLIKTNGTFSQILLSSGKIVYSNEGRWEVNQGDVILINVFLGVDVWNLHAGKPAKVDSFRAHWNSYGPAIVFSEDEHYWVEKQFPKQP